MMTVFTFLGPSWMIRSYSIPSSAMSQPHWYNWYCCSTRTGRTDRPVGGGWPAAGGTGCTASARNSPTNRVRLLERTTLRLCNTLYRLAEWNAFVDLLSNSEKPHPITPQQLIVKEHGKLFYRLLDEGVMDWLKTSTFFFGKFR